MSIFTLSSCIICLYTVFWLLLSRNTNNLEWSKAIKKISNDKSNSQKDEDSFVFDNPEPHVIDEIPWIFSTEYAKYDFLHYSVRELSYPEEKTRYYAVVTMTGGEFNKNKVNAIIQYNGNDKKLIYNYGFIPPEYLKNNPIIRRHTHIWTFDEVKRRLNAYIKDKLNGVEDPSNENWMVYYRDYAYFFDTIEGATFALYAFKQTVDEKLRKKSLAEHNISENVINVKFDE